MRATSAKFNFDRDHGIMERISQSFLHVGKEVKKRVRAEVAVATSYVLQFDGEKQKRGLRSYFLMGQLCAGG